MVSIEVLADNDAAKRLYDRRGYDPHRIELRKRLENDRHSKDDG
jgi:ribosomal protein S18 acetylase RimI-like enzyme